MANSYDCLRSGRLQIKRSIPLHDLNTCSPNTCAHIDNAVYSHCWVADCPNWSDNCPKNKPKER